MALTIKPITSSGKLVIYDGDKIVGNGWAVPSKSEPGYITLTLRLQQLGPKKLTLDFTQVVRVPISWFLALRDLPDPEHDPELR